MSERELLAQALAAQTELHGILPEAILETVKAVLCSRLEKLEASPDLSPRRKQVSVLFADLSSFTAASEQMDAEDVSNLFNAIWQRVDTILRNHGGQIDKHMGNAVMALWGANQGREDDTEQAVRAGLEILKSRIGNALQNDFPEFDLALLNFRVGIHTGPVLLGPMGLTHEFTAIGDTVNTASRLQNAAQPDDLWISQATYDMVCGLFKVEALLPFKVKGKSEPLVAYRVLEAQPRTYRMQRRGIEGILTPLIGREAEWECLCEAYQKVQSGGRMGIVTLLADSGMGKSRLMDEFENWLGGEEQSLHSRGDVQRQNMPYAMIRDLFTNFCEIQENDPPEEARHKLEAIYVKWLGDAGPESAAIAGHLLGFDFSNSPYLHGLLDDPEQLHTQAFAAIQSFFRATAGQTPVVIYLDDIHWADDGSLEIFLNATQALQNVPIFALIAARPSLLERFPDWYQKLPGTTWVQLEALSTENGLALAKYILQRIPEIPAVLLSTLTKSAEGNPFYLEELIKMLIEQEIILPGPLEWRVDLNRLRSFTIPPSLTGVLQARLDHLEPDEDQTIQYAAVIGRVFWDRAIAALGEGSVSNLQQILDGLCNKGLIEPHKNSTLTGTREFIFKQGILQEVAYQRVLKVYRRSYHHQTAEWLVAKSTMHGFEYTGLIAEHYEKANDALRAATWQTRAGNQAMVAYLQTRAYQAYSHALKLFGASLEQPLPPGTDPALLLPIYENLHEVFNRQGNTLQAGAAVIAMLAVARAIPDAAAEVRALCYQDTIEHEFNNNKARYECIELAEKIAFAMPVPDPALQAQVLWCKAGLAMSQAHYTDMMSLLEQTRLLAQQAGDRERLGSTYNLMGFVHIYEGRMAEGRAFILQALEIQHSLGHQRFEAGLLSNIGETYRMENNFSQAVYYYHLSMDIYKKIGSIDGSKLVQNNLGGTLVAQGNYQEAMTLLLAVAESPDSGHYLLAETNRFLAEAYLGLGQPEEALAAARQALKFSLEADTPERIGPAWRVLGVVIGELGRPESISEQDTHFMTAPECFQASLDALNVEGHEIEREETLRVWEKWRNSH